MLLAVHSHPGANNAVYRHYPYWQKSGAETIVGIGTIPGLIRQMDDKPDLPCEWPEGMEFVNIGGNSYIDGKHLPQRLLDTLEWFITERNEDHLCIIEWDTVFFKPIPTPYPKGMSSHLAGGKPWNLACNYFIHNPYLFDRETAGKVLHAGKILIAEGEFVGGSPDTFLGLLTERFSIPLTITHWIEFSRNALDNEGDLEKAREAYLSGVHCIHGIKQHHELEFITK